MNAVPVATYRARDLLNAGDENPFGFREAKSCGDCWHLDTITTNHRVLGTIKEHRCLLHDISFDTAILLLSSCVCDDHQEINE
jgi:hypothetical protein